MDCFHGSIGDVEAERRLREQRLDSSYLFRESAVESGLFILSHINNERVKHVIVPSEAKCYDDCILDMEHLVGKLNAPLVNPVPPPSEVFNYWRPGWRVDELKCPVCSLDFEDKTKQRRHLQVHKLTECSKCHKYEPTNSISNHLKVKCGGAPELLACDHPSCDYRTVYQNAMNRHKVLLRAALIFYLDTFLSILISSYLFFSILSIQGVP